MSLWQSAHIFESMKKFDGITLPVLVFDDDGQNGDCGPAPSSAMLVGTIVGFLIGAGLPVNRNTCSTSATPRAKRIHFHCIDPPTAIRPSRMCRASSQRCGCVLP